MFKAVAKPKAPSSMATPSTLVLGSESKIRQRLLQHHGFDFTCVSSAIDEKSIRHENPSLLVTHLAMAKGTAVAKQLRESKDFVGSPASTLILTADQVVVTEGNHIMEKPSSREQCEQFLKKYSGASVQTVCGLTVTHAGSGKQLHGASIATIHFKLFPASLVTSLASDPVVRTSFMYLLPSFTRKRQRCYFCRCALVALQVMSCAGGLCIEHVELRPYITKIEGKLDSVLGLDVEEAVRLLRVFHGDALIPKQGGFRIDWHELPYLETEEKSSKK